MNTDFLQKMRKEAYFSLYLQILVILVVAGFFLFLRGKTHFFSVIIGGISWLLPSFYFTRKLFIIPESKKPASHIIKNFYLGEVLKLTISGVLLVIAFKFLSVDTLAFLAGYITAVLSIWLFIPFTFNKSGKV